MPRKEIKVAIADDSPFEREILSHHVHMHKNCKVVLLAVDGYDLLQKLENVQPDIIVLDMYMPEMGGLEALEHLRLKNYGSKILCVSSGYNAKMIEVIKQLGADGYCPKLKFHFDMAFQFILNGKSFFDETIDTKIIDEFSHTDIQFSGKENEIVQYLSQGFN